jgi:prevent-host-death family protein
MTTSIAQSRQNLSSLIEAAQSAPQVITKRNKPVAVLVSADYFSRSEASIKPPPGDFYTRLMQIREAYPVADDQGLVGTKTKRKGSWTRPNEFVDLT